jgi:hypothetical protein
MEYLDLDYFSWIFLGEKPESEYQFIRKVSSNLIKDNPSLAESELIEIEDQFTEQHLINYIGLLRFDQPSRIIQFYEFHYEKFKEKYPGQELDFLFYVNQTINDITGTKIFKYEVEEEEKMAFVGELPQERKRIVEEWIENKRLELKNEKAERGRPIKKIKWKGSPAIFGYFFIELVRKGFISPPLRNGEMNYAGYAKLLFAHFDIPTNSLDNIIKEINPGKNTLSDTKRAKFTIPELSELL